MKCLFQEVCALKKYNWEKQLPDKFVQKWENWVQDLENANSVVFAHCYFAYVMRDEQLENVGLYGFSDTSKKAYCALIYLVSKTSVGYYSSELCLSQFQLGTSPLGNPERIPATLEIFCLIPLPQGKNDGQIPGSGAKFSQTRRNCSSSLKKSLRKL